MFSRITLALLLALTLVVPPLPVSARTCILSNSATEKACRPACCANMSCCNVSENNTAPATPPLAKGADHGDANLILAPAADMTVAIIDFPSVQVSNSNADFSAHSPPILALNCARLI